VQDGVVLDDLDSRLAHALQLDGRAPFSRLATVLGVSEQTVARRFRRLRADGVVRVLGMPTPSRGEPHWFVRVRVQPAAAEAVGAALARRPDVTWVCITSGGAEITFTTRPAGARQRDLLLLDRLPRTVQVLELHAFEVLHDWVGGAYEWTAFPTALPDAQAAELTPGTTGGPATIEPDDQPLLDALAVDGRLGWAELAARTGWSESRVARRVDALRAAGALFFDLEIDPGAFGHPVEALLWLGVAPGELEQVGEALARAPESAYTAALTGPSNLLVVVTAHDRAHLYRFITERVGSLPVRSMETSPVLRRLKQAASPPGSADGARVPDPVPVRR
jgi:DNA-binding Lrp family transcriptional regulator